MESVKVTNIFNKIVIISYIGDISTTSSFYPTLFNRPGVAGAVLQSPVSTHSFIHN